MPLKTYSLRARATTWYVGMLAVALLVFSIFVYVGVRTYLKVRIQRGLTGTALTIEPVLREQVGKRPDRDIQDDLARSQVHIPDDHFLRISEGGRLFFVTGVMSDPDIPLDQIALPAFSDVPAYHRQRIQNSVILTYTVPVHAAGGRVLLIETGATLAQMNARVGSLAQILWLGSTLIILAAAAGGYYLMKQPLRPLVLLAEKAEAIGRTELGERLPVPNTGDELERLTVSLNQMIGRLEEALAHNHRFSADASHELRTPLTIMHGEVEDLLERDDLPASALGNLVSLMEEIDRMSRIVSSLMTITRLDAGGERMNLQDVDLTEMARSTAEHMRLLAEMRTVALEFCEAPPILIPADPMRLSQVLVNLIDNAIKYTPDLKETEPPLSAAQRKVQVALAVSHGFAELTVRDHGMGIAAESLPFVFDRFYRADYARTRVAGGEGLGLAIVKAIVEAHRGTIVIASELGKGSTVTVRLPLASTSKQHQAAPEPLSSRAHSAV